MSHTVWAWYLISYTRIKQGYFDKYLLDVISVIESCNEKDIHGLLIAVEFLEGLSYSKLGHILYYLSPLWP